MSREAIHLIKREVCLADALHGSRMELGWGGGQRNKEEASGPSVGELYIKAEKSIWLIPWILEEFL